MSSNCSEAKVYKCTLCTSVCTPAEFDAGAGYRKDFRDENILCKSKLNFCVICKVAKKNREPGQSSCENDSTGLRNKVEFL